MIPGSLFHKFSHFIREGREVRHYLLLVNSYRLFPSCLSLVLKCFPKELILQNSQGLACEPMPYLLTQAEDQITSTFPQLFETPSLFSYSFKDERNKPSTGISQQSQHPQFHSMISHRTSTSKYSLTQCSFNSLLVGLLEPRLPSKRPARSYRVPQQTCIAQKDATLCSDVFSLYLHTVGECRKPSGKVEEIE